MWSGAWLWFGFMSLMANETAYLSMYSLANFKKCLLKYCPFLNCIVFFFFYYWVLIFCCLLCDFHIFSPLLEFCLLSVCCLSDALWSTVSYFWCGPVCFIYLLLAVLGFIAAQAFLWLWHAGAALKPAALTVWAPVVGHRISDTQASGVWARGSAIVAPRL